MNQCDDFWWCVMLLCNLCAIKPERLDVISIHLVHSSASAKTVHRKEFTHQRTKGDKHLFACCQTVDNLNQVEAVAWIYIDMALGADNVEDVSEMMDELLGDVILV